MQPGDLLEWWETPLLKEGYKYYFIAQGSWQKGTFTIPIDCSRGASLGWDRWLCLVKRSIWVRVVIDEFSEVPMQPKLPEGTFRGPFYRIVGSTIHASYEKFLRDTGTMRINESLHELLISSMENQIHILTREEPSFEKINPPAH